jgi:hypothetical protein
LDYLSIALNLGVSFRLVSTDSEHHRESLRYKNLTFTIEVVNGPRLEKVRIYQHFASLVSAR